MTSPWNYGYQCPRSYVITIWMFGDWSTITTITWRPFVIFTAGFQQDQWGKRVGSHKLQWRDISLFILLISRWAISNCRGLCVIWLTTTWAAMLSWPHYVIFWFTTVSLRDRIACPNYGSFNWGVPLHASWKLVKLLLYCFSYKCKSRWGENPQELKTKISDPNLVPDENSLLAVFLHIVLRRLLMQN